MARRRYLVAYDIRDDRRLRLVAGCMEGFGTRIQYSVFICDLSERELFLMRGGIESRMKMSEDSVMIVDLGAAGDSSRFLFLGHRERLPSAGAVIVLVHCEHRSAHSYPGTRSQAAQLPFPLLDTSIVAKFMASHEAPLAAKRIPAAHAAQISRAVLRPITGRLHCGTPRCGRPRLT